MTFIAERGLTAARLRNILDYFLTVYINTNIRKVACFAARRPEGAFRGQKLSHFGFEAGKGVNSNYGIWKPVKQKFRFIASFRKDQQLRDNEENQRSVRTVSQRQWLVR